jgi:hypothetical protein
MRHAPLLEVATAKPLGRLQCRSVASSSSLPQGIFVAPDGSRLREFVFEVGQSRLALATAMIAALAPQWPHLEHMRAAVHWRAPSSCLDLVAVVRHRVRLRTLDVAGLNDERGPEKIVDAREKGAALIADTHADTHVDPHADPRTDVHTAMHVSTSRVARVEAHHLCKISLRMAPRINTGEFWCALRLPRLRHLPFTTPLDCTEMPRARAKSEEMDRDAPAKMHLDARTRCEARRGHEPSIGVAHLAVHVVDTDSDDGADGEDDDDDGGDSSDGGHADELKRRGRRRATAAAFSWFPALASVEFRGSDVTCLAALRVASEIQPPLPRLARIGIDLDGALGANCVKTADENSRRAPRLLRTPSRPLKSHCRCRASTSSFGREGVVQAAATAVSLAPSFDFCPHDCAADCVLCVVCVCDCARHFSATKDRARSVPLALQSVATHCLGWSHRIAGARCHAFIAKKYFRIPRLEAHNVSKARFAFLARVRNPLAKNSCP